MYSICDSIISYLLYPSLWYLPNLGLNCNTSLLHLYHVTFVWEPTSETNVHTSVRSIKAIITRALLLGLQTTCHSVKQQGLLSTFLLHSTVKTSESIQDPRLAIEAAKRIRVNTATFTLVFRSPMFPPEMIVNVANAQAHLVIMWWGVPWLALLIEHKDWFSFGEITWVKDVGLKIKKGCCLAPQETLKDL